MRYALTHWPALTRYCDDGSIQIGNNAPERGLPGRRGTMNYLIAGSDAEAERRGDLQPDRYRETEWTGIGTQSAHRNRARRPVIR